MSTLPFSNQNSLDELISLAEKKFKINFEPVRIGSDHLEIVQIADMESYIDHLAETCNQQKGLQLPFWARVWPTSILLSYYVQRLSAFADRKVLEIGAGIGLCGLIAAQQGFKVTITDNSNDALLFAQINILKNNLAQNAEVAKLDFCTDSLSSRFFYILGSEILYREETYQPLVNFLEQHIALQPEAEIILARNYKRTENNFFELARQKFKIQEKHIGYKSPGDADANHEKQLSTIYRLRPQI